MRIAHALVGLIGVVSGAGCRRADGRATHDECVRAVAQEVFFEDIDSVAGSDGSDFAATLQGETGRKAISVEESMAVIRAHDAGRPPEDHSPSSDQRIEACVASATHAHVDCVVTATSSAALRACPK